MDVEVLTLSMFVTVDVDLFRRKQFAKGIDPEEYEHAADDRFQFCFDRRRDLELEKNHQRSYGEKGNSVADAPHSSDQRRDEKAFLLANDRRDGRQMVSLDRMLQPKHEADQ